MRDIAALKVALVGLPPDTGDKKPSELSGGMRKRASLARALALDPELLFLDEPTAGLDPIGAAAFDALIRDLQKSLGLTVFLVTHDLDTLMTICDRIAVLVDQRIKIGSATEIRLDHNKHDQVRVTVEVDAQAPIKSDSVASLELTGITGIYYIEISGGTRDAPPLTKQEGQRYPVIAAKPSRFASLVASAPEVLNRVIEVADRLSQILDEKNRQAIAQTLANLQRVSEVAGHDLDKVDALLDDARATVADFRRTTMPLVNGSLTDLQKALVSANTIINDLAVTTKGLNIATSHLDALIQENRPRLKD